MTAIPRLTGRVATIPHSGTLLVACPPLDDPWFDRAVVLMLEHGEDGSLGVLLNRPTDESLPEGLDEWKRTLSPPQALFIGGPVEPSALIALTDTASGWASLDLDEPPEPDIGAVRIFRGYAGWSAGQLDAELAEGAWMVLPSERNDLHTRHPNELWRRVLRRQGGRLAWIADAPDHLSMN
jgi:putative transcriptional regulator